jgi:hypothetical protein
VQSKTELVLALHIRQDFRFSYSFLNTTKNRKTIESVRHSLGLLLKGYWGQLPWNGEIYWPAQVISANCLYFLDDPHTILVFVWRDWGKPWRLSVRIAGVPAKIQTEHLPNTSLEHYHYTNKLDLWVSQHCFIKCRSQAVSCRWWWTTLSFSLLIYPLQFKVTRCIVCFWRLVISVNYCYRITTVPYSQ